MQAQPRAAVCGPLLLNADKSVQRSIDTHPTAASLLLRMVLGANQSLYRRVWRDNYHPSVFNYAQRYQVPDGWLTGAVLLIHRSVFAEVGLLDEAYYFMNEDADWGLAVSRAGWETWLVPEAVVTHLLGGSRNSFSEEQEIRLKVSGLCQNRYYVRKNLGLVRYGLYRSGVWCCHALNLVRGVVVAATSSPEKRPGALFKRRLAWLLLLAAMEIKRSKVVEIRP